MLVSAAYVVPPFDVTRSRSSDTGSLEFAASCAAPVKVAIASCVPCSGVRPSSRRLLHRFDEVKHVGGTAARHGRHRVDLRLVVEPDGLADGAQDGVRRLFLLLAHAAAGHHAGDAHADQGWRIRHAAHDGAVITEPARQVLRADAGGDRQDQWRQRDYRPTV